MSRLVRLLPLLILAVSLIITHQLWKHARQDALHELKTDFDFRVHEAAMLVEQRIAAYEQVLHGVKGLFAASVSVERDEFREYANMVHLEENLPGIRALRFIRIVPLTEKDRHIAAIRKEGFPDYTIWPEGRRDFYAPVVYNEPSDARNRPILGYDMYSDREHPLPGDSVGVRRAAMERARDSGKCISSGKLRLISEDKKDEQAGFLMFLPIYRNGAPRGTLEERRANILGWVSAVFRMDDLMNEVLGGHAGEIHIEIYDGDEVSARTLMHDSGSHDTGLHPLFRTTQPIQISGHHWTMAVQSLPMFETGLEQDNPRIIAGAGSGMSLLLALLAWLLVRDRQRTLQIARNATENEARLREMFENMNSAVAVWQVSPNGQGFVCASLNRAAEQISKIRREDAIGKNIVGVFPDIEHTDLLDVLRRVWKSGTAEYVPPFLYQGGHTGAWIEGHVYKFRGQIVAIYDDVTERKRAEEQADYLVNHDALTHLPNRTLITDRIRQALAKARRDRTRLALLFIDLDNFKPVNDGLGHDIGDLLLTKVAKRLQDCMRESDTVARLGGDEFIALLPTIETEQDAVVVAEKICHALCQPFESGKHSLIISCSIGIAVYPEHGNDEDQLIKHADIAMYHAKEAGRNNAKIYRTEMREAGQ